MCAPGLDPFSRTIFLGTVLRALVCGPMNSLHQKRHNVVVMSFLLQFQRMLLSQTCFCTSGIFWICNWLRTRTFERQTWLRKTPRLLPCLLPNGKYVCTVRWSLLTAQGHFVLPCLFFQNLRSFSSFDRISLVLCFQ